MDISKYFTWKEALYLPSWNIQHIPSEQEKDNIIKLSQQMDIVREFLNTPLNVHCWIRPILNNPSSIYNGQNYNNYVGGAHNSSHITGHAVDFNPIGMTCEHGISLLLPKLEEFNLRMEQGTVGWIHLDNSPVITNRYFKP